MAARYRSGLARHPFLLFGLPFIATMVAGSFFLTPATAIRYEKHDRKVRRMSKEEELGIGKGGRRVDMKEEYYVSFHAENGNGIGRCRNAAKTTDMWTRIADTSCRDWQLRTWTIGNKNVLRDFQESMMESYNGCQGQGQAQHTSESHLRLLPEIAESLSEETGENRPTSLDRMVVWTDGHRVVPQVNTLGAR